MHGLLAERLARVGYGADVFRSWWHGRNDLGWFLATREDHAHEPQGPHSPRLHRQFLHSGPWPGWAGRTSHTWAHRHGPRSHFITRTRGHHHPAPPGISSS